MADILATVSGQSLAFTSMPVIASHGVNEDYVEFTFDAEWTGYSKTATFYHERFPEDIFVSIVNGSNRALVPHEVTANAGRIFIGVTGTQGSIKLTSEVQPYPILPGSNEDGVNSEPITPELYDQILSAMAEMVGTPLTANTAADMVDTTRIYVYTGSEAGYVNGSWYYYNGSSWVVGGTYNSQAISDAFYNDIANLVKQSAVASESDSVPYLYRPTPNPSAILADEEIVGGTVAMNQQFNNSVNALMATYGTLSESNNEIIYTVKSIGANYFENQVTNMVALGAPPFTIPSNHVVFLTCETYAPYSNGFYMSVRTNKVGQSGVGISNVPLTPNTWNKLSKVTKTINTFTDVGLYWSMNTNYAVDDSVKIRNVMVIDLTAAFGSTIADYLYTLESGTAGAGVAKLREWGFLSKVYFPYNAGELISVNTEGKRVTGANIFGGIPLRDGVLAGVSSATYDDTAQTVTFQNNKTVLQEMTEGVPFKPNTQYTFIMTFAKSTGTGSNLQIDYTDGTYDVFPALSDATKKETKTFTTAAGKSVLGMSKRNSGGYTYLYYNESGVFEGANHGFEPYRLTTYPTTPTDLNGIFKLDANNQLYADGDRYKADGTITRNYAFRDYEAGDESLANAITDGVHTVVKKNTPTTDTADPYPATQIVGKGGTEEWIDNRSVPVPVGHRTTYSIGVPDVPASANNATLHATVSGGKTTLTWS